MAEEFLYPSPNIRVTTGLYHICKNIPLSHTNVDAVPHQNTCLSQGFLCNAQPAKQDPSWYGLKPLEMFLFIPLTFIN